MDESSEHKWYIELVQDRYQYLSLSYGQAEQIYLHEQNTGMLIRQRYSWKERLQELSSFHKSMHKKYYPDSLLRVQQRHAFQV